MARRSGYIRLEVSDFIEEVEDDVIEDEFRARKLHLKVPAVPDSGDIIRDAYEELMRNRPAEARAILERVLFPKWKTVQDCAAQMALTQHKRGDANE